MLTDVCLGYQAFPRIIVCSFPESNEQMLQLLNEYITLLSGKKPVFVKVAITQPLLARRAADCFLLSSMEFSDHVKTLIHQQDYKGFFVYQDPRDQLVRMAHRLLQKGGFWLDSQGVSCFDDLLLLLIHDCSVYFEQRGINCETSCTIVQAYGRYLPWSKDVRFYTTTIEKVLGPAIGSSSEFQTTEIKRMAAHIGITISTEGAKAAAATLAKKAEAIAQAVSEWRTLFKQMHVEAFKDVPGACKLLMELGYEKNEEWDL